MTLLSSVVLVHLAAYVWFALKNPDSLRSEQYLLTKEILGKTMLGDNTTGLIEAEPENAEQKLIAAQKETSVASPATTPAGEQT